MKLENKIKIINAFFEKFKMQDEEINREYHFYKTKERHIKRFEEICDQIMNEIINFYYFDIKEDG